MPMPRRPPTHKEIVEAFSDLSLDAQTALIAELSSVHRILKRERGRTSPVPEEWLVTVPPEKRMATTEGLAVDSQTLYREHEI